MKKRLNIRRRLSLTPLIDVIFLLLLFFMLDTTFSRFSEVEVSVIANQASKAKGSDSVHHLTIAVTGLILDGKVLSDTELVSSLQNGLTDQPILAIRPDNKISTQRMIDVLALLKDVLNINIRVVTPQ